MKINRFKLWLLCTISFTLIACAQPISSKEATSADNTPTANTPMQTSAMLALTIPETNCEIRLWYNYQVVAISKINQRWKKMGLSLKERAKRAFNLRHNARVNARFMMKSQTEVVALQQRDVEKYGNPDGPTFDYLIQKYRNNGTDEDSAYEDIILRSSYTDSQYNQQCVTH